MQEHIQHNFTERDVEVIFDGEWDVIKLDKHKYYKRVSGLGISGVDFMAVHPEFGIALVEMKNYTKGKSSISVDLDIKMKAKRDDSLRLINVVHKYFQRQLYFRVLNFIGWKYLYPKEWNIWLQAKKHLDNDNYFFLGVVDY